MPLLALPLVPMLATTFRLGLFGAVASITIVFATGVTFALLGKGPIYMLPGDIGLKTQSMQLYFACIVLMLLPAAAELKMRKRLFARLAAAENMQRFILECSSDAIMRLDRNGKLLFASPSIQDVSDLPVSALIGDYPLKHIHPDDAQRIRSAFSKILKSPDVTEIVEYRMRNSIAPAKWTESSFRAALDQQQQVVGVIAIARDVTQRHERLRELKKQAETDPLTGIANRRAFELALKEGLEAGEEGRQACLALFDLDRFKQINDRWGHATGDLVLSRFTSLLRDAVREGDTVARVGGEEFALLLADATIGQAQFICERIRNLLAAEPIATKSGDIVHVTVSAGLVKLDASKASDQIMDQVDRALYEAKQAGRNRLAIAA